MNLTQEILELRASGEVVFNMPRGKYDRIERVNFSTLEAMADSPKHYRYRLTAHDEDTKGMKLGRVTHIASFEPDVFRSRCIVWEGGRRYGKEWNKFRAEHEDLEILTPDEYEQCIAVQAAVRSDQYAAKYLSGGRGEVTALWTHVTEPLGGTSGFRIDCKGRMDFVTPTAIVDLKTTQDASRDGFARSAWKYRYHARAAFYVDGYAAATGQRLPYVILAAEMRAPHVVQVYHVTEAQLELGREEYRAWLRRLDYCRNTNTWPGYFDGETELSLPRWAVDVSEDEDVTGLGLIVNGEQ